MCCYFVIGAVLAIINAMIYMTSMNDYREDERVEAYCICAATSILLAVFWGPLLISLAVLFAVIELLSWYGRRFN